MRLWSIHPRYLDAKGLVAAWREALLARHVLTGKTRGYKHHPQLIRFKLSPAPKRAITAYLLTLRSEAENRGYSFKSVGKTAAVAPIRVTRGQIAYEFKWLCSKLKKRDPAKLREIRAAKHIRPNPIFRVTAGPIESWEKNVHE